VGSEMCIRDRKRTGQLESTKLYWDGERY